MNDDQSARQPLQVSLAPTFHHQNVVALNLAGSSTDNVSKKARLSLSGSEKIDRIYNSVHDIEKAVKLIRQTTEYPSSVTDPKQLKLAIDALAFSSDAITDRLRCISNCSNFQQHQRKERCTVGSF